MDKVTLRVIIKLREELLNLAETGMRFPKGDPFDHGIQVGQWQGLALAHDIIESVLSSDEDDEKRL